MVLSTVKLGPTDWNRTVREDLVRLHPGLLTVEAINGGPPTPTPLSLSLMKEKLSLLFPYVSPSLC